MYGQLAVLVRPVNDMIGQLGHSAIGCEVSKNDWLVVKSFDASVCQARFV